MRNFVHHGKHEVHSVWTNTRNIAIIPGKAEIRTLPSEGLTEVKPGHYDCCHLTVKAKITRILSVNIFRQFFFAINIEASTRFLVKNFQLICYSQRVNATSQYNDSGSSRCSKWPNDRMVVVVKHWWLLVQGKRGYRER